VGRTPLALLLLLAAVFAPCAPVVAQLDERLITARKLYDEANADLNAGRMRDGIPKARESMRLRETVLGPDHSDVALSAQVLGALLRDVNDYAGAKATFERALAIRERALGPEHPLSASSLAGVGYLTFLMGDLPAARPLLERALAIREKAPGPANARDSAIGFSLNDLAIVLTALGEFQLARANYERALAIRERVNGPDHPLTATVLNNFGDMLREFGDRRAARQFLERGLKIREAGRNELTVAASLGALALLNMLDGDYPAAKTQLDRALEIRERLLGPEHLGTATTLFDLGRLYVDSGRYGEARMVLERALRVRERLVGPEHATVGATLRALSDALRSAGDGKAARPLIERALAIYEKRLGTEHPATANTLQSYGNTLLVLKDYPAARARFERALAIREKAYGPNDSRVAQTVRSLAYLSRIEGDPARARAHGERALRVREQALGPDHPAIAWELHTLGQILRVSGDLAGARAHLERALALGKKHGMLEIQWRAASGLGAVNERARRWADATASYRDSVQAIEQLAGQFEDSERAQYLQGENRLSVYDALARVLLKLHEQDQSKGYDREAFAALEAKKGRVVAEALGGGHARVADPNARKEAEDVQAKQDRMAALERALREEQDKAAKDQNVDAVKDLTTKLAQTKSEYLSQVQTFLTKYPKYKTLFVDQQTVDPKVLAKFADRLPAGTLVVQYFSAPDALYVFVVAAGGQFQVKTQPVKQDDLYGLVKRYRTHLKAAENEPLSWNDDKSEVYRREVAPLKDATAKLSAHLLGPIAAELSKYRNVVFIPNDLLLYLPLHALTRRVGARDQFLAETHVVSYLTQLELLDLLAPAKRQPDAPLLALANPDGSLPGATREVRALRGVRPALTMLEGEKATKAEFLKLASTFPQLHLATHGVLDPERPERSYLLVAGADERSTQLTIGEIAGLSLQRALAILSACETAVGEQVPGAALITLAAAFSQAGAEAIVASLWKVNDVATRDFMVTFHKELGAGQATALHKAQLSLLGNAKTAHPFYWAAFVLIGAR
jgi:CHAT domain-containing protein